MEKFILNANCGSIFVISDSGKVYGPFDKPDDAQEQMYNLRMSGEGSTAIQVAGRA